jgi:acyl carrier protein
VDESEILSKLVEILRTSLKLSAEVDPEALLLDDLGLDSLDMVQVTAEIEEGLGINLEDLEEYEILSVGDLVRALAKRAHPC